MPVVTTFNFMGRTEESVNFYRDAVGAEVLFLVRFRDGPPAFNRPGIEDKVFHVTFRIGETQFMASDVGCDQGPPTFAGFALAIVAPSVERARQMFDALSVGGTVLVPFAPSAFTSHYGVVTDRFGLSWKITM